MPWSWKYFYKLTKKEKLLEEFTACTMLSSCYTDIDLSEENIKDTHHFQVIIEFLKRQLHTHLPESSIHGVRVYDLFLGRGK